MQPSESGQGCFQAIRGDQFMQRFANQFRAGITQFFHSAGLASRTRRRYRRVDHVARFVEQLR